MQPQAGQMSDIDHLSGPLLLIRCLSSVERGIHMLFIKYILIDHTLILPQQLILAVSICAVMPVPVGIIVPKGIHGRILLLHLQQKPLVRAELQPRRIQQHGAQIIGRRQHAGSTLQIKVGPEHKGGLKSDGLAVCFCFFLPIKRLKFVI